jgi:hypothetical protein
VSAAPSLDLLALDEASSRLAEIEPAKAELIKLRFFAGLTMPEAAAAVDTPLASSSASISVDGPAQSPGSTADSSGDGATTAPAVDGASSSLSVGLALQSPVSSTRTVAESATSAEAYQAVRSSRDLQNLTRTHSSQEGPGVNWWQTRSWTMWPPVCSCHAGKRRTDPTAFPLSRRLESGWLWTRRDPARSKIRTFSLPPPRQGCSCADSPPADGPSARAS